MDRAIDGRTVLVTGASSGIGAATARTLAGRGCPLVLVGRDEARLEKVCRETGGRAVPADLTEPEQLHRVAAAAEQAEVVVHNAGVGWSGEFAGMSPATTERMLTLNLTAPLQLTGQLLPGMRRRGSGHIVFVSSVAVVGVRGEAVYSGSKAGLRAFAASLRYEVAADGIGVTTVFPGAVRTPFFETRGRPYDRRFPRQVEPETVAERLVHAVEQDKLEVFVPGWLSAAARVQASMPSIFHRLARRFGES